MVHRFLSSRLDAKEIRIFRYVVQSPTLRRLVRRGIPHSVSATSAGRQGLARQNNRKIRSPVSVVMDPERSIALDRPVWSKQNFLVIVNHSPNPNN
jgi:hypothetical protein